MWLLALCVEACHDNSLHLVAMPFVSNSFLLLVVRPGAPSSILAPSSKVRRATSSVRSLLVAPFTTPNKLHLASPVFKMLLMSSRKDLGGFGSVKSVTNAANPFDMNERTLLAWRPSLLGSLSL